MRASVLYPDGSIGLETRSTPTPGPQEVLVEVAVVGVCGSDVHYHQHGRIGTHVVEAPLVLGHEASGTIVAVGEHVDSRRVGERVSLEPQRTCSTCVHCTTGRYNLCSEVEFFATPPIDGAFCEYVTVPAHTAHSIPRSMTFDEAALLEPLSVAVAALRKGGVGLGSTVCIAGGGPVGIITALTATALGAREVLVVEPSAQRRALAAHCGVAAVVPPEDVSMRTTSGPWADCFIDASGNSRAVYDGIQSLRPAGVAVLVGLGSDAVSVPLTAILDRELVITGVFRYANTWPTAIELVERGLVDLRPLVTSHHPLEDAAEALRVAAAGQGLKSVVQIANHPS